MAEITLSGRRIRFLSCHTLVIGAGAAGLNCADELKKAGIDVLAAAPSLGAGTSLNAGSDKQTFYKLSLAGQAPDSPAMLASVYMQGGAVNGDTAYALAAGSARAFYKLVELGVPFPQNELGEFVGYRTDHDTSLRATSAGPLTSRFMAERLKASCDARGVRFLEGYWLGSLLKSPDGRVTGAVLVNDREMAAVSARVCVLAAGGPAGVYSGTVYPKSQSGASGCAIAAGASMANLCYWQYGLASQGVLWNVSGSYQQAIPSYRDERGREFLAAGFRDVGDRLDSIFRKGYQWPFDAGKLSGSSRVDREVLRLNARGGRAYLDFRREEAENVLGSIGDETRAYLANCGALLEGPYNRLAAINRAAADFYKERGIDLSKEPLEIRVCAQHCNGGAAVDRWWRTDVPGLYAAGECAGVFGIYRPGGSALNETQVGSLRAAQHIAAFEAGKDPLGYEEFLHATEKQLEEEAAFFDRAERGCMSALEDAAETVRDRMDICAGALRDRQGMRELYQKVSSALDTVPGVDVGEKGSAVRAFAARNDLYTIREALSSMLCQGELSGTAGHCFTENAEKDAPDARNYTILSKNGQARCEKVRPLPEGGGWFETVWKDFRENRIIGR
ncbi:MAG: FAD-binding protein [Clostridia bacterium]|nr:FAD-binding protein [Clostridia bacterium]